MSKSKRLDKFPNYVTFKLNVSSTPTADYQTVSLQMPIPRVQTKGKATIMELLWVEGRTITFYNAGDQTYNTLSIYSGTPATTDVNYDEPSCIAQKSYALDSPTFAPVNTSLYYSDQWKVDLQSNDGYGFLFAGDKLNLTLTSQNSSAQTTIVGRIYYRFVDVSIQEYVGIVQSFQS